MRTLTGKVVSTKMNNTIVVEVATQSMHPIYKKFITRTKRYKVHNEDTSIKEGDVVNIVESKPVSKEKHFKVHV